ncbi:hypothetical protein [Methylacidimicrobium tartarophylax]|uniref:Uncharacterized protein n=1 Tax=Methylacidimicrobium tartarophylax TaxID=1041768 RepID=A0A5E6MCX2_9BACT|nr:hypothetical protein [Methylacidimicrobium tartarophylax]VVM07100.1 hypothetical protein MAMT_01563 [Methylacidimicrobium tartarophylax]
MTKHLLLHGEQLEQTTGIGKKPIFHMAFCPAMEIHGWRFSIAVAKLGALQLVGEQADGSFKLRRRSADLALRSPPRWPR